MRGAWLLLGAGVVAEDTRKRVHVPAQHRITDRPIRCHNPNPFPRSDEERNDVLKAYEEFEGDVDEILDNIMCST
jgi:hypothetical protein